MSLTSDLLHFREQAARLEGIESFKVLSKANIDAIAFARPKNKEELMQIKGIKEARYRKYGQGILAIVTAHSVGESMVPQVEAAEVQGNKEEPQTLSVHDFLGALDTELSGMAGRVRGEVTEFTIWQKRMVFFSLKDTKEESTLRCSMSYQNYLLTGTEVAIGTEVVAEGYPKIYKPRGELSFQVMTLELFGEGALKKAYDILYKKLEAKGAFDANQKRTLPRYPERIALITSLDGAALGDFQTNIGRFGLKIDLYPSGVEGNRAIHELIASLQAVAKRTQEYDVLVLIRGGGSLESLAAFNNENLVEIIRTFPIPVLAGIGHEKDVTLASLVADQMESTPTACALCLTSHWENAREGMYAFCEKLPRLFEALVHEKKELLTEASQTFFFNLTALKEAATKYEQQFLSWVYTYQGYAQGEQESLKNIGSQLSTRFLERISEVKNSLQNFSQYLAQVDPNRVLSLGYSILRKQGKVLRSIQDVKANDILHIRLADGTLVASVKEID